MSLGILASDNRAIIDLIRGCSRRMGGEHGSPPCTCWKCVLLFVFFLNSYGVPFTSGVPFFRLDVLTTIDISFAAGEEKRNRHARGSNGEKKYCTIFEVINVPVKYGF